jgi:hypothetical protein
MVPGRYLSAKDPYLKGADRPAPAHKTGVGAVKPETEDESLDTAIELLGKGLKASADFLKRATAKDPQGDTAMSEEFRKTLDELIKAEAQNLVEELPYGKVIVLAFKMSVAFGNGAGKALLEVSAKMRDRYDREFAELKDEIDERGAEIIQDFRTYQAHSVGELNGILLKGLEASFDEFIDFLKDELKEMAGGVLKDICGQLAKQLIKRFDLLSIFGQGIDKAAKGIPEGRGRVERVVFSYTAQMFLDQFPKSQIRDALKAAAKGVKGKGAVDAKVLAGLLEFVITSGFETFAAYVKLDEAHTTLREMVMEGARKFLQAATEVELAESKDGTVKVEGNKVLVPANIKVELTRGEGALSSEERRRFIQRNTEYYCYVERHALRLDAMKLKSQRRIDRTPAETRDDVWIKLNNQMVEAANGAKQEALAQAKLIHGEFGDNLPEFGPVSEWFDAYAMSTLNARRFTLDRRYGWP